MSDPATIAVRVVVLGRSVKRITCAPETSLGDVLQLAGVEVMGKDIHVNGRSHELASPIGEGALVTVIPQVRGGQEGRGRR